MSPNEAIEASGPAAPEAGIPELTEQQRAAVDKLRECLETEIVALAGYDVALKRATHPQVSQRLLELRGDHARRADLIRSRIKGRGAAPDDAARASTDGPLGSGAGTLGELETVVALEELELQGVGLYRDGLQLGDPSTRIFFETVLLPAQRRTHDLCRSLEGFARK